VEILVLHPGALGDIILSLPALSLLRRRTPQCRITLSGNLDYLGIVPRSSADQCRSLSTLPLQRLFDSRPIPESDVRLWTSFDGIVSWTGSSSEEFAHHLQAIHPNALVASWKPARGEQRHVSRIFYDSLSSWISADDLLCPVEIVPRQAERRSAVRWLRDQGCSPELPLIALHPGSGGAWKCWPADRYAILADRLSREWEGKILLIEGPAEPGLSDALRNRIPSSGLVVAKNLPLEILTALLAGCRAYVGNDSGISHLAAALGIPCVVIFGPTAPEQWKPLGRKVTVLRDNSSCQACASGLSDGHRCLLNIAPESVWMALLPEISGCSENMEARSPAGGLNP
jgi:heptosyltransferase-2